VSSASAQGRRVVLPIHAAAAIDPNQLTLLTSGEHAFAYACSPLWSLSVTGSALGCIALEGSPTSSQNFFAIHNRSTSDIETGDVLLRRRNERDLRLIRGWSAADPRLIRTDRAG